MRRQTDLTGHGRRRERAIPALCVVALLALLLPWPAGWVAAAEAPSAAAAASPAATDAERFALHAEVDGRYRVLPTVGGLLLEPREEIPGIQTIEIAGGEVAINGEPVAPTILTSWLGDAATPLLDLAALPEDEARALFTEPLTPPDDEAAESEDELAPDEPDAPEAPVAPDSPEDPLEGSRIQLGERVIFGRSLTIDENEVASEVVVIGGAAHIRGVVDGGVVAVGGPVIVEGRVRGEVVSVGGAIEAGPDASIGGDVVSVGGSVRARDDQIGGDVVQVGFPWIWSGDFGWSPDWGPRTSPIRAWAAREAVGNVAVILLLGLMTAFLLLVARGPVERAALVIARQPGSSLASGFAMWIFQLVGIWLAVILLALTIVGCFALPLVPVLWLFGWLLFLPGYAAAALATGRWLTGRFGWNLGGAYGTALAGVLAIEMIKLLGNVLAIAGGPIGFFATLIEITGGLIVLVAWTVGVGAVVMNLLNRRRPAAPLPPGPLPPAPLPPTPLPEGPAPAPPPAPTPPPAEEVTGPASGPDEPPRSG